MCESLLLFIQSSRQGHWNRHLASLNAFVKYFSAHDQLNYARLTPLYLANMLELQTSDRKTWDYLEQSFIISKSKIPFTSIGSDHAMEQENKRMKISGVIGLTQNDNALNRFCLTAPVLNSILEPFYNLYDVTNSSKRQYHYQVVRICPECVVTSENWWK